MSWDGSDHGVDEGEIVLVNPDGIATWKTIFSLWIATKPPRSYLGDNL